MFPTIPTVSVYTMDPYSRTEGRDDWTCLNRKGEEVPRRLSPLQRV